LEVRHFLLFLGSWPQVLFASPHILCGRVRFSTKFCTLQSVGLSKFLRPERWSRLPPHPTPWLLLGTGVGGSSYIEWLSHATQHRQDSLSGNKMQEKSRWSLWSLILMLALSFQASNAQIVSICYSIKIWGRAVTQLNLKFTVVNWSCSWARTAQ
jgi:hypothetical protein